MKKTQTLISIATIALASTLVVACGGDDGPDDIGDGDGDGAMTGGGAGDGDGDGDVGNGTTSTFVTGGRGTNGAWDGYTFAVAEAGSTIMPLEFTADELCVTGTLGASYEEWALVGWNIAQEIDPETFVGGAVNSIAPGGSGVQVVVSNPGASGLRVQIQTDESGTESWCAPVPASGSGTIPWGDFKKECWTTGGAAYDGVTPIAQVAVQTFAGSDMTTTAFDYCVITLGPAP